VLTGGSGGSLGGGEGCGLVDWSDDDIHDVVEVGSGRNCHDRDLGRTGSGLEVGQIGSRPYWAMDLDQTGAGPWILQAENQRTQLREDKGWLDLGAFVVEEVEQPVPEASIESGRGEAKRHDGDSMWWLVTLRSTQSSLVMAGSVPPAVGGRGRARDLDWRQPASSTHYRGGVLSRDGRRATKHQLVEGGFQAKSRGTAAADYGRSSSSDGRLAEGAREEAWQMVAGGCCSGEGRGEKGVIG
jgi:hypothetical protein